ncbi:MAG TPA: pyridoxamine 5'-phosphate oxidase family protein, partial [Candidatus Hydrogenedentes bacterium]|nr:pyridoxamine 5'-phosphate oxidase family protein [Candidatus Hydrogenedentota bacterium]
MLERPDAHSGGSCMKLEGELRTALAGEITPKFLATLDAEGRPNCVPVISITPYDDEHLVFGEFMMNKTRRNLAACDTVGIAVVTETLDMWSLKGTFLGFETTGERVEEIDRSPLLRYNAYTSARAAGLIRVEVVSEKRVMGKLSVLGTFLRAWPKLRAIKRAADARAVMPARVEEKFGRLSAVRVAAYRDGDGYPHAFGFMAGFAAGPSRLVLTDRAFGAQCDGLAVGAPMAVCILTMDPIAYQVKGTYAGQCHGVGVLE